MTILRICERTTGKTEVPLFHIDRKNNLADLLTKKCNWSMESVYLDSVWQTSLLWMKLDTSEMPLLAYDQLKVEKPIEDEVRVECYDQAMTGEFSQFEENSVHLSNSVFSHIAGLARVQVNLEIDLYYMVKALNLINYLLALPKIAKHIIVQGTL